MKNSPANTIAVLDNDTFRTDGSNTGAISFPTANDEIIVLDDGETANDSADDTILHWSLYLWCDDFHEFINFIFDLW